MVLYLGSFGCGSPDDVGVLWGLRFSSGFLTGSCRGGCEERQLGLGGIRLFEDIRCEGKRVMGFCGLVLAQIQLEAES